MKKSNFRKKGKRKDPRERKIRVFSNLPTPLTEDGSLWASALYPQGFFTSVAPFQCRGIIAQRLWVLPFSFDPDRLLGQRPVDMKGAYKILRPLHFSRTLNQQALGSWHPCLLTSGSREAPVLMSAILQCMTTVSHHLEARALSPALRSKSTTIMPTMGPFESRPAP